MTLLLHTEFLVTHRSSISCFVFLFKSLGFFFLLFSALFVVVAGCLVGWVYLFLFFSKPVPQPFTIFSEFHDWNTTDKKNYLYFILDLQILNFIWCLLFTLSSEPTILQICPTSPSLLYTLPKLFLA